MAFMTGIFLGVRIWILFYFGLSLVLGLGTLAYLFRERLRRRYYHMRWPEKLIKLVVYYPGNKFRTFWRLIPDDDTFQIDKKPYLYTDKAIMRTNDFYVRKDERKGVVASIEGTEYNVIPYNRVRSRWDKYPELHYKYNVPYPIDYSKSTDKEIAWTSEEFADFKEHNLWKTLLTMDTQKSATMLLFIICIINTLISVVLLAKNMGWIK